MRLNKSTIKHKIEMNWTYPYKLYCKKVVKVKVSIHSVEFNQLRDLAEKILMLLFLFLVKYYLLVLNLDIKSSLNE